jgi:dihydroflavonol-4-reductase
MNWNRRTVAITGATGFVGSHLARLLKTHSADVRALVRPTSCTHELETIGVSCHRASLDDPDSLVAEFDGCDTLFHLAGAVDFNGDWRRLHEVNVEGTINVLRAAQRAGVRRAVVTSSIVAVAGSERPKRLDESAPWNLRSLNIPYVATKREAERQALGERFGDLQVVVVNPSCVIGPDDGGSEFGVICQRFWNGRIPFFFGGGANFVDVRDVALGHLAAAEKGRAGERYLLTGSNVSWHDFFVELSRAAQRVIPRLRLPAIVGEWFARCEHRIRRRGRPNLTPAQAKMMPMYFYFQHDKAARELGFRPRSFRETVAACYRSWVERDLSRRAVPEARVARLGA